MDPRGTAEIPYAGLEVVDPGKKEFTLRWPGGDTRFRGAAKTMIGPLLEAITSQTSGRS